MPFSITNSLGRGNNQGRLMESPVDSPGNRSSTPSPGGDSGAVEGKFSGGIKIRRTLKGGKIPPAKQGLPKRIGEAKYLVIFS
jgi:hypothetical protein